MARFLSDAAPLMQVDPGLDTAVFLGPSLSPEAARVILPANYYPPIRHGDLYQLRASPISRFVIIDGVFDATTPVWHREILQLLNEGRAVVGASSMGALRAMELQPYGMKGFGTVYDWYRQGVIQGDDEVALFHADESFRFAAITQPLVNIRYNLQRATIAGVLSEAVAVQLLEFARFAYYGDRTLPMLYTQLDAASAASLQAFFDSDWVDVKAEDARGVLEAVAGGLLDEPPVVEPGWFERSHWNSAELSMPVTYGGSLIDGQVHAHAELLSALRERQQEYEPEYYQAVTRFFLEKSIDSDDRRVGLEAQVATPAAGEPDPEVLHRNGLTRADWLRFSSTDGRLKVRCHSIRTVFPDLVAEVAELLHREASNVLPEAVIVLGDWASQVGCPSQVSLPDASPVELWQAYQWLLEQGPVRLGYTFDPVVAVFQQLQYEYRVAEIASC